MTLGTISPQNFLNNFQLSPTLNLHIPDVTDGLCDSVELTTDRIDYFYDEVASRLGVFGNTLPHEFSPKSALHDWISRKQEPSSPVAQFNRRLFQQVTHVPGYAIDEEQELPLDLIMATQGDAMQTSVQAQSVLFNRWGIHSTRRKIWAYNGHMQPFLATMGLQEWKISSIVRLLISALLAYEEESPAEMGRLQCMTMAKTNIHVIRRLEEVITFDTSTYSARMLAMTSWNALLEGLTNIRLTVTHSYLDDYFAGTPSLLELSLYADLDKKKFTLTCDMDPPSDDEVPPLPLEFRKWFQAMDTPNPFMLPGDFNSLPGKEKISVIVKGLTYVGLCKDNPAEIAFMAKLFSEMGIAITDCPIDIFNKRTLPYHIRRLNLDDGVLEAMLIVAGYVVKVGTQMSLGIHSEHQRLKQTLARFSNPQAIIDIVKNTR
jgi:hypothetical protein